MRGESFCVFDVHLEQTDVETGSLRTPMKISVLAVETVLSRMSTEVARNVSSIVAQIWYLVCGKKKRQDCRAMSLRITLRNISGEWRQLVRTKGERFIAELNERS